MLQKLAVIFGTLTFSFFLLACDMIQPQASRPSVVISSPPSGSVYTVGEQVVVQSTASDPARILRVELIVDGVSVRQDSSPVATGQEQFSLLQTWTAKVGQHNIIVRATNAQGAFSETGIYIIVQAAAQASPTATTLAATEIPTATTLASATALASVTTNPAITVIVTATSAPKQAATNTTTPTITTTSSSESASCTDSAAFVSDVTIPDNTNLSPNTAFTKTWRVRNTGTCNWQNYQLVFGSGAQLSGAASVPVPATAAGATADISVPLTAPATAGNYKGTWRLRNASGIFLGTSVTVLINVPSPNTAANATATNTTIPPTLPAAASCSGQPANFTFTASASTINAGQSVTLNWGAVSNASIAVLNGGQFNQQGVGAPGSITATPNATTTYTLTATCNNGGGTRTNSVTVTVNSVAAPPAACSGTPAIDSFTSSSTTIYSGGSVLLTWQTTNADQVNLTGGNLAGGGVAANGSVFDQPSVPTIYRLSALCTANGLAAARQLSVSVVECVVPAIGSFTASSNSITAGESVTLSWGGIPDGKIVVLRTGNESGEPVAQSGSQAFSPATTTTYTLRVSDACLGAPRQVEKSVTVTVTPAGGAACSGQPTISSFTASATTIQTGQSVTLSWGPVTNADSVIFDNSAPTGGGEVTAPGALTLSPTTTTTYYLVAACRPTGNIATKTLTVTVTPAGVGCSGNPTIATFNASATTITQGQVVTLSWDGITNYDEVRFYSGGTDFETVGPTAQRNRIPNQTTTYELTALCNASGTSTIRLITVTVNP